MGNYVPIYIKGLHCGPKAGKVYKTVKGVNSLITRSTIAVLAAYPFTRPFSMYQSDVLKYMHKLPYPSFWSIHPLHIKTHFGNDIRSNLLCNDSEDGDYLVAEEGDYIDDSTIKRVLDILVKSNLTHIFDTVNVKGDQVAEAKVRTDDFCMKLVANVEFLLDRLKEAKGFAYENLKDNLNNKINQPVVFYTGYLVNDTNMLVSDQISLTMYKGHHTGYEGLVVNYKVFLVGHEVFTTGEYLDSKYNEY